LGSNEFSDHYVTAGTYFSGLHLNNPRSIK
jgi:hypothetical protein